MVHFLRVRVAQALKNSLTVVLRLSNYWHNLKDMTRAWRQKQALKASRTISQAAEDFDRSSTGQWFVVTWGRPVKSPAKTFKGRERTSLLPRWLFMWTATLTLLYFGLGFALRAFGLAELPTLDEMIRSGVVSVIYTPTYTPTVTSITLQPTYTPSNFSSSSYNSSEQNAPTGGSDTAPIPLTFTPYPTYTPYPTQPPIVGKLAAIGYSYYWPPWGPPNCAAENWHADLNYCDDVTASGLPWSQYIGRAVAVPVQWRDWLPLGSSVRVHSPPEMVGLYLVIDYCGKCIKPEGHIYLDFLDNRARLNWTVPMLVEFIVLPPTVTPTATLPSTLTPLASPTPLFYGE